MFPGYPENCNVEGTLSKYSWNIACRLGLMAKIYKKITANDSKSYLDNFDKLVDQYNNTYHHSINKKPINDDFVLWLKKLRQILKPLNLKLMMESELLIITTF